MKLFLFPQCHIVSVTISPFSAREYARPPVHNIVSVTISSIFGNNYLKQLFNYGGQPPANLRAARLCGGKSCFYQLFLLFPILKHRVKSPYHSLVLKIGTGNILHSLFTKSCYNIWYGFRSKRDA